MSRTAKFQILVLGWALVAGACSTACSDGEGGEGAAGGSSAGTSGTSCTSVGGSGTAGSTATGPCRSGMLTDAAALFAKHAGNYPFSGGDKPCTFAGATFTADGTYTLSLESPGSVTIASDTQGAVYNANWDDEMDYACAGEFVDSFELNDGMQTIRIGFIGTNPSSVSLDNCSFLLD
jgi:hypothetical protein